MRKGQGSSPAFDPYQCAATCAAQQGFCPKPENPVKPLKSPFDLVSMLQLGLSSAQWGPLVWKRLRLWLGFGWMRRGRQTEVRSSTFRWPRMESLRRLLAFWNCW